jgi:hypothetical protein
MKVILAPSWALSNEYPASRYGQPVLLYRNTGETFGAWDFVQACPIDRHTQAAKVVARFAKTLKLDEDGAALVARFVGSLVPSA